MADELRSLLQEAKPSWSAQDLVAVQRKLTKIGIQSAKDLAESFSQLNELLSAAGFLKFSHETLDELKQRLPSTRPKVEGPRRVGFGGPSPHQVFQHHRQSLQVNTFDWKGWVVKALRSEPLVARPCVMAAYAAELDEQQEEEDDESEALSEEDMMKLCVAKRVPLLQLERGALSVIRQLDLLEKASISALRTEYKKRGFAPDPQMRREALLALVKEVIIWENLKLEDLEEVCRSYGLPVQPKGPKMSRSELMQLLADRSWSAVGIPVQQLPSLVVAHGILDSVATLHGKQLPELIGNAQRQGVPLEKKPDREELILRLVKAMVWKQMDDAMLRAECDRCGAPLEDIPETAPVGVKLLVNNGSKSGRQKMERLLLQSLWLDIWKAKGISVQSLNHDSAAKLFAEVELLHSEDLARVQQRYKALDLPQGQVEDEKWVMQRVSESLFWEALPLAELEEECEMRGLAVEKMGDEGATRSSLVRKLVKDSCLHAWAKMGIPVARLGDAHAAASVAEEWRGLENISSADLKIKCELHGVPVDAGLERHDLLQLLKDVAVWESMPLHELKAENAGHTVERGLDEFRQHCQLVEQLLLRRCADFYERKGIPAQRLGSLKAAAALAKELADLEGQDSSSLKSECRRLGLPADHLRQQELLQLHREIALWRALPAAELRLECRAKSVAPESGGCTEQELKEIFVDALLVEKCEAWYERRGIPVRKLGSVRAAMRVAEKWEQLDTLSEGGLLFKASAFSIHVEKDCKRTDVIERVKMAMLWNELPLRELQKMSRSYGLHCHGRDSHKELLHRLTATLWPPPPPPPPEPKPRPMKFEQFGTSWQSNFKKAAPAKAKMLPHLKTLGLPASSTMEDVKKAYRKLALKYHPDKNLEASKEEASQRFREVATAYAALNQLFSG